MEQQMLKDLKQSNDEDLVAIKERQHNLMAKTIISYFLEMYVGHWGCVHYACPLGRESGTGHCGPRWIELTRTECINKIYRWFKEKMEE